jgi:hypothetical protein
VGLLVIAPIQDHGHQDAGNCEKQKGTSKNSDLREFVRI